MRSPSRRSAAPPAPSALLGRPRALRRVVGRGPRRPTPPDAPVQLVESRPDRDRARRPVAALGARAPGWSSSEGARTDPRHRAVLPLDLAGRAHGRRAGARSARRRRAACACGCCSTPACTRTYPRTADSLARLPGFEVRLVDFRRIAGGVQHAKFFLVDGETTFLGSQNFDWRALKHIHELGVRGPRPARDRRLRAGLRAGLGHGHAGRPGARTRPAWRLRAAGPARAPARCPTASCRRPATRVLLWPSWSPRGFIPDTTLWDRDRIVRMLDGARHEVVVQFLSYSLGRAAPARRDARPGAAPRRRARRDGCGVIVSDWETGSSG